MGKLSPFGHEYNLLASMIEEGLLMMGQECLVYTPSDNIPDENMDSIHLFKDPIKSIILFADDLTTNKLKNGYWSREKGENIEAFISIRSNLSIVPGCVIDITPHFYNESAKFIVNKIEGQVNSIYLKVFLVPYRKSKDTELKPEKDMETKINDDGLIKDRPYLKR